jgi:hypothetical protein
MFCHLDGEQAVFVDGSGQDLRPRNPRPWGSEFTGKGRGVQRGSALDDYPSSGAFSPGFNKDARAYGDLFGKYPK